MRTKINNEDIKVFNEIDSSILIKGFNRFKKLMVTVDENGICHASHRTGDAAICSNIIIQNNSCIHIYIDEKSKSSYIIDYDEATEELLINKRIPWFKQHINQEDNVS